MRTLTLADPGGYTWNHPLGERRVDVGGQPLPLAGGVQGELGLLKLCPRLFELDRGAPVGGLLEAALDQLDDGAGERQTTLRRVGCQPLFRGAPERSLRYQGRSRLERSQPSSEAIVASEAPRACQSAISCRSAPVSRR
jgi:hypothetical protein